MRDSGLLALGLVIPDGQFCVVEVGIILRNYVQPWGIVEEKVVQGACWQSEWQRLGSRVRWRPYAGAYEFYAGRVKGGRSNSYSVIQPQILVMPYTKFKMGVTNSAIPKLEAVSENFIYTVVVIAFRGYVVARQKAS